jgi:hypothetical protein
VTPAGAAIAKLRASATVTAAGNNGTFRSGSVPPGTAHPLTTVAQVGGPVEYTLKGDKVARAVVVVQVVDEQEGSVAPVARAYAVVDAIDAALNNQALALTGGRVLRIWREVEPTELPGNEDGVSDFRVTLRYTTEYTK